MMSDHPREANCSCLQFEDEKPDACGNCVFGFCPRCTYPNSLYCQRHAPVAVVREPFSSSDHGRWPTVHRSDWCGDYQRRPAVREGI